MVGVARAAGRTRTRVRALAGALAVGLLAGGLGLVAAAPASAAGTGVIGDLVWNDADRNGIQNTGEVGIPGVTVHLQQQIAGAWVEVGTTTTNANGGYSFTLLDAATLRTSWAHPSWRTT